MFLEKIVHYTARRLVLRNCKGLHEKPEAALDLFWCDLYALLTKASLYLTNTLFHIVRPLVFLLRGSFNNTFIIDKTLPSRGLMVDPAQVF